ncbi:MAG TPA: phosphatase PAP2 family protein [Bryobacteraceae bacterium]|nr:phosphatase PAP2 family protein [Bryobacteraceae bacterium]
MDNESNRWLGAGLAASVAALLLFLWLARLEQSGAGMSLDTAVRQDIHAWSSPLVTRVMEAITQLGSAVFLIALGAFLTYRLAAQRRHHAAVMLAVVAVGAAAVHEALTIIYHRARPEPFFGLGVPSTYSFPSGHAMGSAAFYGIVAAVFAMRATSSRRKAAIWLAAALLAALIGFSRVYLGVHYPTDVLAGYAAAIVWAGAVRIGYEVWQRRRRRRSRT